MSSQTGGEQSPWKQPGLVKRKLQVIDSWMRKGRAKVLLQLAFQKDPAYIDAPLVFDLATTDRQRQILTLSLSPLRFGRPFMAPPGVSAERIAILRAAFVATMKDPEFLADATKQKIELMPLAGQDIAALVASAFSLPSELVKQVQAIMN